MPRLRLRLQIPVELPIHRARPRTGLVIVLVGAAHLGSFAPGPAHARPAEIGGPLLVPAGAPLGELLDRPVTAPRNRLEGTTSRVRYGSVPALDIAPEGAPGVGHAYAGHSGAGPRGARTSSDTLSFGNVGPDGFAILGDVWTFDHGGPDPLEGWFGVDLTVQTGTYGRHIDAASWEADPYNEVPAPVLAGTGSAWIGAYGTEARSLCWEAGLGSGNDWVQRLVSPLHDYDGLSTVTIDWSYFSDSEPLFDYTFVYLERWPSRTLIALRRYDGPIGLAPDHPASPPTGVADGVSLTPANFLDDTGFRIVFEFSSDGSWSDEDALHETDYGPFGFDEVVVDGFGPGGSGTVTYAFESDLEGWTAEVEPGIGDFVGVAPSSDYDLDDVCVCDIAGNVLEMHDTNGEHPEGQHLYAASPSVDMLSDVPFREDPGLVIFADWTEYVDLPRANGVFVRPGWQYWPWVCEITGEIGWSPPVHPGQFFTWEESGCVASRTNALAGELVPVDAERLRFLYELYSSCDAFGIDPNDCSGVTNFTPLLDNVQIRFTRSVPAPNIAFELGLQFQDGFAQGTLINDPTKPGRADVTRSTTSPSSAPGFVLGDSLQIAGPIVTNASNRWEAHFWFHLDRVGPGAGSAYGTWRSGVIAGSGTDPEAGFSQASMDSAQLGTNAFRNKFASYLKEQDFAAWGRGAAAELTDASEIIQDHVLYPGTSVQYFVTANYLDTPTERFFLPDTSGGFFLEFEILPSWRDTGNGLRYPCFLYVDAFNGGAQSFIQPALDSLGIAFDRYDYLDATSNWKAPMARGRAIDANNGCTLAQLLGYRGLFVNTGTSNVTQLMWPDDYAMFSDWLTAVACNGSTTRQGLVMNGDDVSLALDANAPTLLARMGATHVDDWYADFSGNLDTCVRLEGRLDAGELYGTEHSGADYAYDAWGNGCPQTFAFDVLGTFGTGTGNRVYLDLDDLTETHYSQVVTEKIDGGENYRTVLDGVSWHHLATPENGGLDRCVASAANITAAAFNELAAAIEWIYDVDYGEFATFLCDWECGDVVDLPGDMAAGRGVTRLFPSAPNPFSPRTAIRFALSASGPVTVAVFDVAGRRVRTLLDGEVVAGSHEVVWDARSDDGRPVASGTYWARMEAGGRRFASRLVHVK